MEDLYKASETSKDANQGTALARRDSEVAPTTLAPNLMANQSICMSPFASIGNGKGNCHK